MFLALSRSRPALADLDKVIQLKADFLQARVQRATVLMKMGRLDEAHIDVEKVLAKEPSNDEASKIYITLEPLKKKIQEAQDHMRWKQYEAAIETLTEILVGSLLLFIPS